MNDESTEKLVSWQVVVNHEEQYSIWPTHRPLPLGWRGEGKRETRDQCLDHIAAVWTDMRPRSLRERMDAKAQS